MKLSFCTILFLIFLTLKLAGIGVVAAWSWVWVFSPLWIPIAIFLAFLLLSCIGALILGASRR